MRNKLFIPVLIAGLAAASEAMAQYCELEKLHVSSQGDGVSADFSSVDTSTCAAGVETTIHVEGSQGLVSQADLCGRGSYHIRTVTETQTVEDLLRGEAAVLPGEKLDDRDACTAPAMARPPELADGVLGPPRVCARGHPRIITGR